MHREQREGTNQIPGGSLGLNQEHPKALDND